MYSAATPAACGADMDVPVITADAVSEARPAVHARCMQCGAVAPAHAHAVFDACVYTCSTASTR